MTSEVIALRAEIAELRAELAKLRLEVSNLQQLVTGAGSGSEDSFSVVGRPTAAASGGSGYYAGDQVNWPAEPAQAPSCQLTWQEREAIALEVGQFLKQADRGVHRGESGRAQIPLASRYWIVARGFNGEKVEPLRVFSRWAGAKALVRRGAEVGRSVFVGLPSLREVKAALRGGGFHWNGQLDQ